MKLCFKREGLLHDISNLAYVAADVGGEGRAPHELHQAFDICEEGNVERVDRVLHLRFSEVRVLLGPLLKPVRGVAHEGEGSSRNCRMVLQFRPNAVSAVLTLRIKEVVREYLVAMALADWLALTLPGSEGVWKERGKEAMTHLVCCLNAALYGSAVSLRRALSPF